MTKRSTISTLPPQVFVFGQGVYAADAKEVIEQVNYSGAHNAEHLAGGASGPAGWGASGNEVETHGLLSTGTLRTVYVFQVWIHPDTVSLHCAARLLVTSGETHEITFQIGSAVETLTHTHASGGVASVDASVDILVADIGGTGLQAVKIDAERTTGSADASIASWNIRGNVIADGALPSPPLDAAVASLSEPFSDWIGYWSAEDTAGIGPYSWAAAHGAGASALTCSDAYTGGVLTTPLLAAGIGATRVDEAVSYGASGFHSVTTTVVPSGALHIRVPPFKPSSESTGYLFSWVFNASSDHITARFASSTSLVITWNSPTVATYTTTIAVTDGAWHMLDLIVRPTGGAAGVAAMDVFLNGVDLSPADHSVAMTVPTTGRIGVGCWYLVGQSPMSGALLGWGIRAAAGIDLATHTAHAASVGV